MVRTPSPAFTATVILILGLTLAVYVQLDFLQHRPDFRMHGYDGSAGLPEWRPRIASLWLADLVWAERSFGLWSASWFLLSALAWLAARRERAIAPVAILAAGILASYYPYVNVGTQAGEGPIMFFFTLAAITRKRIRWWVPIGLLAIPFKQTGIIIVLAAALDYLRCGRRQAAWLIAGAGLTALSACFIIGGRPELPALYVSTHAGEVHILANLRALAGRRLETWFISGGTIAAGLVAGSGPLLWAMLMLAGAVLFMGQVWEPRIWVEGIAFAAAALGDRA